MPRMLVDDAGRLAADLPCHHCGYNLRTLAGDGRCPECGQSVENSVALWLTLEPAWLDRVQEGAVLLTGSLAAWAVIITVILLAVLIGIGPGLAAGAAVLGFLASIAGLLGVWFVTTPHPVRAQDRRIFGALAARRVARACLAAIPPAAISFAVLVAAPWRGVLGPLIAVPWAALLLALLLLAPALAFHLAALMRHVRAETWQRRARISACAIAVAEALAGLAILCDAGVLPRPPVASNALAIPALFIPLAAAVVLAIMSAAACRVLRRMLQELEEKRALTDGH